MGNVNPNYLLENQEPEEVNAVLSLQVLSFFLSKGSLDWFNEKGSPRCLVTLEEGKINFNKKFFAEAVAYGVSNKILQDPVPFEEMATFLLKYSPEGEVYIIKSRTYMEKPSFSEVKRLAGRIKDLFNKALDLAMEEPSTE